MTVPDGNVGSAIGLVCIAGAAASLGASVVFFPALVRRTSHRVLAASLGLSAGVMIYISFVEILYKSLNGFINAEMDEPRAYMFTTISFFSGILVMTILELIIKRLSKSRTYHREQDEDIEIVWNENNEDCCSNISEQEDMTATNYRVGCSNDPLKELEEWRQNADLELQGRSPVPPVIIGKKETSTCNGDEESGGHQPLENNPDRPGGNNEECNESQRKPILVTVESIPRSPEIEGEFRPPCQLRIHPKEEKRKLVKMGISTALAIILHSVPEGLVTFIAALDDPSVGAVLAVAIGLHNIPEGMCVALPIYYATGNRVKAFMWGSIAGISEPIAAILGWLVLARVMTEELYGALFGFVSGVMIMVSVKELIPTAHRYDPEDTVATCSILVGMVVMGLSLVLFKITGG